MALSFAEYLDLVDRNGRHAVLCLGRLSPNVKVASGSGQLLPAKIWAPALWCSLESEAWALENPAVHWSQRTEPKVPTKYSARVAALATELGRFTQLARTAGPDVHISSIHGSGRVIDVVRMVAHEVTLAAHASGRAAGMPLDPLAPEVASDGIDQWLHLSQVSQGATPKYEVRIAALRCTDTGDMWHLALNGDWNFRLVPPTNGGAVLVESTALTLLLWLQGHRPPDGLVLFTGDAKTFADLREVLALPAIETPKRRWFR